MQEFLDIALRQIRLEVTDGLQKNEIALKTIMANASAKGYLRSGRLLLELDKACAATIMARGAKVWEIVHRAITTGHIKYSGSLANDLKHFCRPFLEGSVNGLTTRAMSITEHMGLPKVQLRDAVAAQARAIAILENEIDLFCAALSIPLQDAPYQPQSVVTFTNSSIGSFQAGGNSVAHVTQTVSSVQSTNVSSAFALVKRNVEEAFQDGAPRFIVKETEEELAKSAPDKSRLRSLAETLRSCVGAVIETAPKIPAAIEAFQKTVEMLPG